LVAEDLCTFFCLSLTALVLRIGTAFRRAGSGEPDSRDRGDESNSTGGHVNADLETTIADWRECPDAILQPMKAMLEGAAVRGQPISRATGQPSINQGQAQLDEAGSCRQNPTGLGRAMIGLARTGKGRARRGVFFCEHRISSRSREFVEF
jgi:hypothetical protein